MDAIFRSIAASQEELRKECQKDFATKANLDDHEHANREEFDALKKRIDDH
jgi:hypothetical protein